jgi:hypothetical protein
MPDAAVVVDAPAADAPPDVAPADAPSAPDARVADVPPPPDARPDLALPEEPCQGTGRGCSADQTATRRCEQGRWVFEQTCLDGTVCSAGDCVCRAGSCQDSVLVREGADIVTIAAGGDRLYYYKSYRETDLTGLHQIDLRSGAATPLVPDGPGHSFGVMVVDATGTLFWCGKWQGRQSLMRGTEVLEPIDCGSNLAVSATHVYFEGGDQSQLLRRALDRPGVQMVSDRSPTALIVAGPYVYFTDFVGVDSMALDRILVSGAQPSKPERVALADMPAEQALYMISIDDTHAYADDLDGVLVAPLAPGSRFQTFWRGDGPELRALAASPTHVYWTTASEGVDGGCTGTTLWRKAKVATASTAAAAPAQAIAIYPGACPSMDLAVVGDYVYLVIKPKGGGSQVLRLRR